MQARIEREGLRGFAQALLLSLALATGTHAAPGDGHRLLVAGYAGSDMRAVDWGPAHTISTVLTSFQNGMTQPNGFTMGPDCRLYVASYLTDEIMVFLPDGTNQPTIPMPTIGSTTYRQPADVVFGPRDGLMYVSAINQGMILRYDPCSQSWSECFPAPLALNVRPGYMTFAANGDLVFGGYGDNTIRSWPFVVAPGTAAPVVELSTGMNGPENIALGPGGDLFIVSYRDNAVLRAAKTATGWAAPGPFASVSSPHGLTFSPEGKLIVGNRTMGWLEQRNATTGALEATIGSGLDPAALVFESRAAIRNLFRGEIVCTQGPPEGYGSWLPPDPCAGEYVVKVIDPEVVPFPNLGANTSAPMFSNQFASNPNMVWNFDNLGHVFGVTVERNGYPSIYVAASPVYGFALPAWGPGGSGCVYRLDAVTGNITQFALLPQSPTAPSGLGDVEWDESHGRLFVSNFENGRIYSYADTNGDGFGEFKQRYDPFGASDPDNDGIVPLTTGSRVWALRVVFKKWLVFSVWVRDACNTATVASTGVSNNALYAVAINGAGDLVGAPLLLRVMPPLLGSGPNGWSNPVSDIDVKGEGLAYPAAHRVLLVAERGMCSTSGGPSLAHAARTLEIGFNGWFRRFDVGDPFTNGWVAPWTHANSAGGAAYGRKACVWATGDTLHDVYLDDLLHGLQRVPPAGNILDPTPTGKCMLIDLDAKTLMGMDRHDVWQPGDVEFCSGFGELGPPH